MAVRESADLTANLAPVRSDSLGLPQQRFRSGLRQELRNVLKRELVPADAEDRHRRGTVRLASPWRRRSLFLSCHLVSHDRFGDVAITKLVVCAVGPKHPLSYEQGEEGRSRPWLGNDHVSRLYAGWPFHVPSLDAMTVAIAVCPWATDWFPLTYQPTPVPRATRSPQLSQWMSQTNPARALGLD